MRRGLPPGSVISVTGMHWTPWARAAQARGVLVRHPMFASIEEDGVRMPDGSLVEADVILWATGFRPALDHLAPLHLRTPEGGSAWRTRVRPTSRGCSSSGTGLRSPPSARTGPVGEAVRAIVADREALAA